MGRKSNFKIKLFIIMIILVLTVVIVALGWYKMATSPVSQESNIVEFEVEQGAGLGQVAEDLAKDGIIRDANAAKIYNKLSGGIVLQAGTYELDSSLDMKTILSQISMGGVVDNSINLTFVEGESVKEYADVIANNTDNSADDVLKLMKDEAYIDSLIDKYWFLTEDIKNPDIYYPLEGYLAPNTYKFVNKKVSIQEIIETMLDQTEKELEPYRQQMENSSRSIHQIMTLASVAEWEGKTSEDRAQIIGVFENRLAKGMSLGSDVTTYYAFDVDMASSDLTVKQLNTANPYNTRGPGMEGKLPVGPIGNPSVDSIEATLNYTTTDAYYFVADKNGKVYFTKTDAEHQAKVAELKAAGLWHTYQ